MTKIEEQATKSWNERYPEGDSQYKDAQIDGFIAGAEYAVKVAKEWLEDWSFGYNLDSMEKVEKLISNFETDMNKLWKEKNTAEKTRVPKGEKYWYLVFFGGEVLIYYIVERNFADDNEHFAMGNYFHTQEEAESMARKLRAVLKGADVIEVSSDINEQQVKLNDYDSERERDSFNYGFERAVEIFKSKIVK